MLATLACLSFITTAPIQEEKLSKLYFVVLEKGPNAEAKVDEEEQSKMMGEHLANFDRLAKAKKLVIVGPMADAGDMRGIVVLDVQDKEKAEAEFKNDPFIKSGAMKLATYEWYCLKSAMHTPKNLTDLREYTIGFLRRGPESGKPRTDEEAKKVQEGHMANINRMANEGMLKVAGPMGGNGDLRGLFFFITTDREKIKRECDQDPAIKGGRLKMDLYTLYMGKGSLGEKN